MRVYAALMSYEGINASLYKSDDGVLAVVVSQEGQGVVIILPAPCEDKVKRGGPSMHV